MQRRKNDASLLRPRRLDACRYVLYLGVDEGEVLQLDLVVRSGLDVRLVVNSGSKSFTEAVHLVTRQAFLHGADYLVRVNDDTEFISPGWTSLGVG